MKKILLSALACPKCHGKLEYDLQKNQLICQTDKLAFIIKDNIPVLLENQAIPLMQSQSTQD
ncbi:MULTISPECIES: Trm112 family protein [unclassified Gilliamella]|uniref:Trm112 family protein n=1 Tax=unclassified Gilliamella TaxID=2685620 RepID=UPI001C69EA62|nr:Trm112 family protein [Gilliamella sp. ESL0441]QYN44085.1 Trm112 family protein [Gilliamella sp. ESL0441]